MSLLINVFPYNTSIENLESNGLLAREFLLGSTLGWDDFDKVMFVISHKGSARSILRKLGLDEQKFSIVSQRKFVNKFALASLGESDLVIRFDQDAALLQWQVVLVLALKRLLSRSYVRRGYSLPFFLSKKTGVAAFMKAIVVVPYLKVMLRLAKFSTASWVTHSQISRRMLVGHQNFVDEVFFLERFKKDSKGKNLVLISVGRLERQKNHDKSIEIAARLGADVTLVGDGSLKSDLKALANKKKVKLELVVPVENKKLPQYFNTATMAIFMSSYEGNPKTLIEYLAVGIPVIVDRDWSHCGVMTNQFRVDDEVIRSLYGPGFLETLYNYGYFVIKGDAKYLTCYTFASFLERERLFCRRILCEK